MEKSRVYSRFLEQMRNVNLPLAHASPAERLCIDHHRRVCVLSPVCVENVEAQGAEGRFGSIFGPRGHLVIACVGSKLSANSLFHISFE